MISWSWRSLSTNISWIITVYLQNKYVKALHILSAQDQIDCKITQSTLFQASWLTVTQLFEREKSPWPGWPDKCISNAVEVCVCVCIAVCFYEWWPHLALGGR
ncbi:hypothetical protein I7I50_02903 [Histoplasma capsulatum G186AR]|uniref:Uncharacterized protein n=1 Tax=Ajellomyces capsulatus TaxID=5037 RepID=A0A8H7Z5X2_AJECA|nr:hypothetical protein I7I52_00431 [Histoplasma capsulatum]QSS71891.1 hypothetical protein I7I50_02903 [Histoplasma capsulatum G186AR]